MDAADSDGALIARLKGGDREALAELFSRHRDRLSRGVRFRLDSRLQGRLDVEDILQEVYLSAAQRFASFLGDTSPSFFIWLRLIAGQTLVDLYRRHLGAQARDAGREVPIAGGATSASMAFQLAADRTSPSQAAIRAEMSSQLERAIEGMDPIDREILALRHFEELTNGEVAEVLGIGQKAASIRYIRALGRLKGILLKLSDFGPLREARGVPGPGEGGEGP